MVGRTLRLLFVEDSERDVQLLQRHLERAGYELISERVDTREAMKAALQSRELDFILCDHSMPQFNALQALALLKELGLDIPFIMVSGTIGEEGAVRTMLAGANDYLVKDNLTRLVPAIERELHEAQNRSARRRAEAALRQSEDRYRDLVENSYDLMCTHDLEGRLLSCNQTAARILGYERDSLIGRDIREALLPEYRHLFESYIEKLLRDGIAQGVMTVRTRSGETRIWEYTNTLRTEGVAEPIVRGMAHDVTVQRKAEVALKTSESELRALFAAMTDVILVLDAYGRYLKIAPTDPANPYKPDADRIGKTLHEVFPKEHADFLLTHIRRSLADGRTHKVEYKLNLEGKEVWFEGTVSPMSKESVVLLARDITEHKQADEKMARLNAQLESQRKRLNKIVANVPGVVWESWHEPDPALQRIDFVSDYVETMLGYSVEEWRSTPNFWLSIVHPEDRERTAKASAVSLGGGEERRLEFRWVAADGRVVWVESNAAVITDDEGRTLGLRGVTTDITERKKLEHQFRQAQKMEAVGQLAGGIAHDFNNILTTIIGYGQLVLSSLDPDDPLRSQIEEIEKAGMRAASLTSQLLAFSRRQVLQPKVLDLNSIVAEMNRMLRRLIGESITLEVNTEPELGRVKADSGQIEQVIMNLVVNARDAVSQTGRLIIETANVDLDSEYTNEYLSVNPGRYVMLAVSDTGAGMDKETQTRVFEPFFTTKEQGKGTGLGLSTVYGIVKQSDGFIWLYSEPGQGTTFKIYLPRVDDAPEAVDKRGRGVTQLKGSETILLVEDEEMVRKLAREVLQRNGYTVLEASNGGEALLTCEQHQGPIHMMITDVVMPQMSGRQLVERLTVLCPRMRVMYMSGYTDDAVLNAGLAPDETFLQKPFMPESLLRKVRDVLDQPMKRGQA
jgi:two-component system, cell cycle sensor histidine kinase and response regulator CckA